MTVFELRLKTWLNKDEVLRRVKNASQPRVLKCGLLVEAEAKRSLSKGSSVSIPGRDEKGLFTKGMKVYTPSPRGQPPHMRTGNLRASITTAQSGPQSCVVGPTTTAWYGRVHEFGALIKVTSRMRGFLFHEFGWHVMKDTIFIPPRPFMKPALDRCLLKFPELFRDLPLGGVA
jgi:HK97 gp10 family phage protein